MTFTNPTSIEGCCKSKLNKGIQMNGNWVHTESLIEVQKERKLTTASKNMTCLYDDLKLYVVYLCVHLLCQKFSTSGDLDQRSLRFLKYFYEKYFLHLLCKVFFSGTWKVHVLKMLTEKTFISQKWSLFNDVGIFGEKSKLC